MKNRNISIIFQIKTALILLVFASLSANATLSSDFIQFSDGNGTGLTVDITSANQGFFILNGQKNAAPNGKFGGGLLFVDSTSPNFDERKAIVIDNDALYEMNSTGQLDKIILRSDLDAYDPATLQEQLDGFAADASFDLGDIDEFTNILEAFKIIVGNSLALQNGSKAFSGLKLVDPNDDTKTADVKLDGETLKASFNGGADEEIITTKNLKPAAVQLLEVKGNTLNGTTTQASFPIVSGLGDAFTAKLANFQPGISFRLQTGTANEVQIISGMNTTTITTASTDVQIPGTNLQVDSFDGTNIVLEKTDTSGINAYDTDIVLEYFGQVTP